MGLNSIYEITQTSYKAPPTELEVAGTFPAFQHELDRLKSLLIERHTRGQATTFYKFGDGDYYFLKQKPVGSAKPGVRAISKKLSKESINEFRNGAQNCDFYMCELISQNQKRFRKVIDRQIDFPAEFVYGLMASRWLLKTFSSKIGLIGADLKLDLVRALTEYNEVRMYYHNERFANYIRIPQKFACDDPKSVRESIRDQLSSATATVFLVGIGHLKSAILHELPRIKPAVYIDVGTGIDALAGIIDSERPYFGSWKNFRIPDPKLYAEIDFLRFDHQNIEVLAPLNQHD